MRYFSKLSYEGTDFAGWQTQPNAPTIQETVEQTLSLVLREEITVVGCGRTDAGVHAREYYLHFETGQELHPALHRRLNGLLPESIAIQQIYGVPDDLHARYSALERQYQYHLLSLKDPFMGRYAYVVPEWKDLDFTLMQEAAGILPGYSAFFPFCKAHSDARHYLCDLKEARWDVSHDKAVFTITSNRFLRGMVRLIVGMCLEVGKGKLDLAEVKGAMETQSPLERAFSAPAHGLALTRVTYPNHDLKMG